MNSGTLYIVSTPIGNLEDITLRALRILKEVDLIAAEDTRKTGTLLNHYHIKKPLTSYFEHNEQAKTPILLERLQTGLNLALVSSAGTPTLSDPGYRLVRGALDEAIPVIPVPGVSAALTALSVSGLPVHRFCFEGFPPPKTGKRKKFLKSISDEPRTLIFYESPHRAVASLADMLEIFGDRPAVLAREITKLYEDIRYGLLSTILDEIRSAPLKGEITLVVAGIK